MLLHDLDGDSQLSRTEFDDVVDSLAFNHYNGCQMSMKDRLWKQTACACTQHQLQHFHGCVCEESSATIATPANHIFQDYAITICHKIFESLQKDCSSFGKETNPVEHLSAASLMRRTQENGSKKSTVLLSIILPILFIVAILSGALLLIRLKRQRRKDNTSSTTNVPDSPETKVATETTKVVEKVNDDEAYLTHSSSSSSQPPEASSKFKVNIEPESIDELANAMTPMKFRSRSLGDLWFKKVSSKLTCKTEGNDADQGSFEKLKMIYKKWLPSFEPKSDDHSLAQATSPKEKTRAPSVTHSENSIRHPPREVEAGDIATLDKSCVASDQPDDLESEWCETWKTRSLVSQWSQSCDQRLEEQSLVDRSRVVLGYDEESQCCGKCRTKSSFEQIGQSSSAVHRVHTLLNDSSFLDQSLVTEEDGYDDRSYGCETKKSTSRTRTWRFCPACGNDVGDLMNNLMDASHGSLPDDDVSLEILQSEEFSVKLVRPARK
jgi:hypothetical protein